MKNLLFVSILVCIFLSPSMVRAHVLKTENTVGVVLHVEPEDDPIAGGENTFLLEFKDTENAFSLENCSCYLTIFKDSEEIQKLPINPISETEKLSAAILYVFPEKGVYRANVSGSHKNGADFLDFNTDFELQVSREIASSPSPENLVPENKETNWPMILGGAGVILLTLFAGLKLSKGSAQK